MRALSHLYGGVAPAFAAGGNALDGGFLGNAARIDHWSGVLGEEALGDE